MNKLIKYLVIILLVLLLITIPEHLIFDENDSLCIFKNLTGIKCPLCGMTRACCLMLNLKIGSAIAFNPLVIMLPLLFVLEILNDIGKTPFIPHIRKIAWIALGTGLVVLFVLRFLDYFSNR